ncbi:Flp pilus assembly protein CpaB [Roseovarius aestuarii]|nr:Flp pilus assembly protein CpaB [Roseovarius aestuarii]
MFSWRIVIVALISVALASGVAWVNIRAKNEPALPPAKMLSNSSLVSMRPFLFAASPIESGDEITVESFETVEMHAEQAGENLLLDTSENRMGLIRRTSHRSIPMGTPFIKSDLVAIPRVPATPEAEEVKETSVRLGTASRLGQGMRAIALPVTGETALARLISQNDRIDVLVSYTRYDGVRAVRTVLRNVRVIETDQSFSASDQPGNAIPKTITLELHPEGAKVLALAMHTGELVLVLSDESADDMPIIANDAPILSTQISGVLIPAAEKEEPTRVHVFRGSTSGSTRGNTANEAVPGIHLVPKDRTPNVATSSQ